MSSQPFQIRPGQPSPLGATADAEGVNFAVFSQHATKVMLCLFDEDGAEHQVVTLPEREGHVWHGYLPGLKAGQQYGYRMDGPYEPREGHRFNPFKLLIDPYAKRLTGHPIWNDALFGYKTDHKDKDLSFDKTDSAPYMPRCVVVDPHFDWNDTPRPNHSLENSVIYEAHVKGLTAGREDIENAGSYLAMASDPILEHLNNLGVTAVELLPVQAFLNEKFLLDRGLTNYWGYMTYGFFAPDPRYMQGTDISEFQQMVERFHSAGIEVILDVVYNHTAEGSEMGPTLMFRGLDNASYYRLADEKRYYIDDAGCGNTLDFENPFVIRLVMDSLRYWVEVMHVDGFRFDLCSALGRTRHGFESDGPFFRAIGQDPVLNKVKLIAEPWDIGPGGYQLGAYPAPFAEWNDKFRDNVREFWRGDRGKVSDLAGRLTGSAQFFDHDGRSATSSLNFLTAHDGFTLEDTVSYSDKNNLANGEDNRDGHSNNHSDNMGVEGATDDPEIMAARIRRKRNLIATLMLSQGTPMMLAGDELSNSQGGNNNAYCQDNEIGWVNWPEEKDPFFTFCQQAIAFRRMHPLLRQRRFLHSRQRLIDGEPDLFWRRSNGKPMRQSDWDDPNLDILVVEMRMASGSPEYVHREGALLVVLNRGDTVDITPPALPDGGAWVRRFDTSQDDAIEVTAGMQVAANAVVVFSHETRN
ncbi:glycogen operon protein [Litoreibacter ascidiaceicola]|uniref:Glycogen operon protein n=1 Tax=Litoreibacter ascidiaceicola TaxID=1486859 RepID=A0A1M5CDR1_9RHOB|nr:glycogen debranching protein GlgX [Litoreibacter ascidiaceicola]SHF52859.1 glycogen operon protein [Litoreibacter ascidiaceicola]